MKNRFHSGGFISHLVYWETSKAYQSVKVCFAGIVLSSGRRWVSFCGGYTSWIHCSKAFEQEIVAFLSWRFGGDFIDRWSDDTTMRVKQLRTIKIIKLFVFGRARNIAT